MLEDHPMQLQQLVWVHELTMLNRKLSMMKLSLCKPFKRPMNKGVYLVDLSGKDSVMKF
jgi:hypothetical protein